MPEHFSDFLMFDNSSPGVFLVKQRASLAEVFGDLILIWSASEASDWENRIIEMPLEGTSNA